jgi:DNA polymerase-3 subunit epsilon
MSFVAIDFETANPCLSSICQIGVVRFDNNSHSEIWHTLVNPEDQFDPANIRVHGITENTVKNAPKFPQAYEAVRDLLQDKVVVHYSPFDKTALTRAVNKHRLQMPECKWLDALRVARMSWPELESHSLKAVAQVLGITFQHHSAYEDARAAGDILLQAIRHTGTALSGWLSQVQSPISSAERASHARRNYPTEDFTRQGNPDGPFAGETIVFTGSLQIPRREAADLAAELGCEVANSVTRKTTLLVVGDQDIRVLAGHKKSSKHRKAEGLIAEGQSIRILGESDFRDLIGREPLFAREF